MSKLIGIAIRIESQGPMKEQNKIVVSEEFGIIGSCRKDSGNKKKLITIISWEQWQAVCGELKKDLSWTLRGANLLLKGINLQNTDVGDHFRIGNVVLTVTGEISHQTTKAYQSLSKKLTNNQPECVACQIKNGGILSVGKRVHLIEKFDDSPLTNVYPNQFQ